VLDYLIVREQERLIGMVVARGRVVIVGLFSRDGLLSWMLVPLCTFAAFACVCVCGVGGVSAAPYSATHFSGCFEFPCGGAGELDGDVGVGADAAGNVYVGDLFSYRADKFDGSGGFLLAWGWGVINRAGEPQVCTSTTGCRVGLAGSGSGQFQQPQGVAVDTEPSSPSYGDVYVVDLGNARVEQFGPEGKFLLMFGGEVDKTTHADVCTAVSGDTCGAGVEGTGNGQFGKSANRRSYIAVGPGGKVYVGDTARVQVFDPSGGYLETISLAGLSGTGKVTALAVDGLGDVFVKIGDATVDNGEGAVAGVREFEPGGIERAVQFDPGSKTVEAITLDALGHVYVADSAGGNHILEYDAASGQELAAFGFGTVPAGLGIACSVCGMAFSGAQDKLYVSGEGVIWAYTPPEPGPLIEPGSETVRPEARGAATFEATVNPEGHPSEVKVEYVDQAHYATGGFTEAVKSQPPVSIGSGFADERVQVKLAQLTLLPGVTYHYRVTASNACETGKTCTTHGEDQSFTEFPAALIDGPWVSEVASTSATFNARIDPLGAGTSYRFEYGQSTAYEHVLSGNVGEGEEYVQVSIHRQDLEPSTTYHYRLVTTSVVGTIEGADHTFTTQPATVSEGLPDGRIWELVSPADKHGALIEPVEGVEGDIQAAADGSGIAYVANEPITTSPPASILSFVLSTRGPDGWGSQEIMPSQSVPEGTEGAYVLLEGFTPPLLLSLDLSRSVLEPDFQVKPSSLSPICEGSSEATERTIVLRDSLPQACYTPLVTCADVVAPCTKFGGQVRGATRMEFLTASRDLKHVIFDSPYALTPGAGGLKGGESCGPGGEPPCQGGSQNLYEWGDGQLPQVNILPDGKPTFGAFIGAKDADVLHTISDDGRWVIWKYEEHEEATGTRTLYVRDMVGEKTLQVGGAHAVFETMSSDGSHVFYAESGDLYELDTGTGAQTDLTVKHAPGEPDAGVGPVLGTSQDGTSVYFIASGQLAQGASAGAPNLYVLDENGGGEWSTSFIATLSVDDSPGWSDSGSSRVSTNGRYLAFMSDRPLTGYDNVDANPQAYEMKIVGVKKLEVVVDKEGKPVRAHDEEVYEYDALSGHLVCVSCDPTGARPTGVLDLGRGAGSLLVDRKGSWSAHWLAGSIGGWREVQSGRANYQPRALSDSGRLFFESPDPLVAQDTNGLEDLYQYEPVKSSEEGPSSNDCSSVSPVFSERSSGCVSVLSSGTSSAESTFYDASENGDDAFFLTASKLVGADYDKSFDVYDAHACTSQALCHSEPVHPPPCESGDSCKPAPTPQPEIFGPPPSATFSGAGNVTTPSKSTVKPRSLTRAQKLARALHACKKKRTRQQRATCEHNARRQYKTSRTHKTNTRTHGRG
jgi:hypothetical protein